MRPLPPLRRRCESGGAPPDLQGRARPGRPAARLRPTPRRFPGCGCRESAASNGGTPIAPGRRSSDHRPVYKYSCAANPRNAPPGCRFGPGTAFRGAAPPLPRGNRRGGCSPRCRLRRPSSVHPFRPRSFCIIISLLEVPMSRTTTPEKSGRQAAVLLLLFAVFAGTLAMLAGKIHSLERQLARERRLAQADIAERDAVNRQLEKELDLLGNQAVLTEWRMAELEQLERELRRAAGRALAVASDR